MTHVVLIPGYATELTLNGIYSARNTDAGFSAFLPLVRSGRAVAFRWGIARTLTFISAITVFPAWALYRDETHHATSKKTQYALADFLSVHNPKTIVAHSLGAHLLLAYCRTRRLPKSVTRIILCQADTPPDAYRKFPDVEVLHVYCPWDPSLFLSSLLHGSIRAGLKKIPGVHSVLIPLWRPSNLHTSSIRDHRLVTLATEPHTTP